MKGKEKQMRESSRERKSKWTNQIMNRLLRDAATYIICKLLVSACF